jgi:hypothetical protein
MHGGQSSSGQTLDNPDAAPGQAGIDAENPHLTTFLSCQSNERSTAYSSRGRIPDPTRVTP